MNDSEISLSSLAFISLPQAVPAASPSRLWLRSRCCRCWFLVSAGARCLAARSSRWFPERLREMREVFSSSMLARAFIPHSPSLFSERSISARRSATNAFNGVFTSTFRHFHMMLSLKIGEPQSIVN